ncbi:ABC transporter [Pseudomonas syringae]|uniref:Amino acid ABC transporter ATP-binding protein n=1 Tax=Pseudomonas syringae pv. apii TaxID=81036 RepID=A0A3M3NAX0_9PSED|nr:Amino acid ABC transporter ATP-binding protein [Pseudomonas syringae pv. apii]RMN56886.1 hypothetical protein ALQ58_200219 [Pseudomonas syringae pv. apii]RMN98712.1 Amino acid ABC transporter ATP-binding protein [Pseudomonas syringae pv. apii]SDZ51246.1 ABC transporter [Pseudomonas syringae]
MPLGVVGAISASSLRLLSIQTGSLRLRYPKYCSHKAPVSPEGIIQMQGVYKWCGQFHVLKDINLNVKQGERIVLCGPSRSGKSTTIRCFYRLEEHQ